VYETAGPAPAGENTKRKQLEYDALGRLTSVCEITSATGSGACGQTSAQTGYWTKYTYDVNNNLTSVTESAQSGQPQTRTYSYDDLGRTTSEVNPESGTTYYFYDSAPSTPGVGCVYGAGGGLPGNTGNYPGDLAKKYDANGNSICFSYDSLHRVTGINSAGPNVINNSYFTYDSATVNGVSMQNAKGRLAEAKTCPAGQYCGIVTDAGFSYTARGEVSDLYESTPHSGGYYHSAETYWANGVPNQLTSTVAGFYQSYGLDGEGRVYSTSDGGGLHPLGSTLYNSASLPTQVNFGYSGDSDSYTYDPNTNRMTQYKFNVNGQSVTGNLNWNAVGTLASLAITDPFNSANSQTCNYSHDDLVRVASTNCGSIWSQAFGYDAFGNLNKSGTNSFQPTYSYLTNHMTQIGSSTPSYDADGNVTNDFLHTYSWDANGRPVIIDSVGITYDALGRMVEQNRGGAYTQVVYAPTGMKMQLVYGQAGVVGLVPLPAGAMAVWAPNGFHYRHADWLGSSRFASTTSRTMYYDGAYAPFGEPYAQTGTSDLSFTGMNQDTVSALYDFPAREYGIQGRWPSPDPAGTAAADLTNPQSWNRYAYVLNSPLLFTDPSGMGTCDGTTQDCADPYCQYTDCGGGMPDYSPPPDLLQLMTDPIRVTTSVCISCLYSDWLDFMYFTSTVGNPVQTIGTGGGGGSATNSNKSSFGQCLANGANRASLAALLPKGTPTIVSNLLSNDLATVQQLAFGPNRLGAAISVAQGRGANAIARGVGAIPYGVDRFVLRTNSAGTTYAADMIEGKIASTAIGSLVATASAAKLAYDAGSYLAGIGTCAVWGQ
jgi:RHS repeat-associated protein